MDSIEDTKLVVDGIEISANEPTKVSFESIEKDEEIEEDGDQDNEDEAQKRMVKNAMFKTDVILNPKVNKKIKAQMLPDQGDQKIARLSVKRKAESSDDEEEIYKTEDIPRTKKMLKIEMKKKLKKEKKNGKL